MSVLTSDVLVLFLDASAIANGLLVGLKIRECDVKDSPLVMLGTEVA